MDKIYQFSSNLDQNGQIWQKFNNKNNNKNNNNNNYVNLLDRFRNTCSRSEIAKLIWQRNSFCYIIS